MQKLFNRKFLLPLSAILVVCALLVVGGLVITSAQAAKANPPGSDALKAKNAANADPTCKTGIGTSGNIAKGVFSIVSVNGNQIQVKGFKCENGKTVTFTTTLLTTTNTTYQPDKSIVAVGNTVFAFGTVNTDSSIVAQQIEIANSFVDNYTGEITSINGSNIIIQAKDRTFTIHTTTATTYQKGPSKSKQLQPASHDELKVGTAIVVYGKLNNDDSLTASSVVIVVQS